MSTVQIRILKGFVIGFVVVVAVTLTAQHVLCEEVKKPKAPVGISPKPPTPKNIQPKVLGKTSELTAKRRADEWSVITNGRMYSFRYKNWQSGMYFDSHSEALHEMNRIKLIFEDDAKESVWEDVK